MHYCVSSLPVEEDKHIARLLHGVYFRRLPAVPLLPLPFFFFLPHILEGEKKEKGKVTKMNRGGGRRAAFTLKEEVCLAIWLGEGASPNGIINFLHLFLCFSSFFLFFFFKIRNIFIGSDIYHLNIMLFIKKRSLR